MEQISKAAECVRSTAIGDELADIAQVLRSATTKNGPTEDGHTSATSSSGSRARKNHQQDHLLEEFAINTTGWSKSELKRAVARLVEERERLRQTLQGALLEAV